MDQKEEMVNQRDGGLADLRPRITAAYFSEETSKEEHFQNETLRPILKLQHPLFIQLFKGYIKQKKDQYYVIARDKQANYLTEVLCNDPKIRAELLGVVIGHFTLEEVLVYQADTRTFNRRILNMLKERILSSQSEFA